VAARTLTGSVVVEHDGREGLQHSILHALGAGKEVRQVAVAQVPDSAAMRLAEHCLERLLAAWLERTLRAAVGLA
jgi:hypothetical protein